MENGIFWTIEKLYNSTYVPRPSVIYDDATTRPREVLNENTKAIGVLPKEFASAMVD